MSEAALPNPAVTYEYVRVVSESQPNGKVRIYMVVPGTDVGLHCDCDVANASIIYNQLGDAIIEARIAAALARGHQQVTSDQRGGAGQS